MVLGKNKNKRNRFSDETVEMIVREFGKKKCGLYDVSGVPSGKVEGFLELEKMIGNNKDELQWGQIYLPYLPLPDDSLDSEGRIPHMTFSAYMRHHYTTDTFSLFIPYNSVVAVFTPIEEHISYETFIGSIKTLKY